MITLLALAASVSLAPASVEEQGKVLSEYCLIQQPPNVAPEKAIAANRAEVAQNLRTTSRRIDELRKPEGRNVVGLTTDVSAAAARRTSVGNDSSAEDVKKPQNAARFLIQTGQADSRATIAVDRRTATGGFGSYAHTLTLSTPTADEGDTRFGRFGDFGADLRASYAFSGSTRRFSRIREEKALARLEGLLRAKINIALEKSCEKDPSSAACRVYRNDPAFDRIVPEIGGIRPIKVNPTCLERYKLKEEIETYRDAVAVESSFWLYSVEAAIGAQEFEVAEAFNEDGDREEDRTPYSLSGSAGWVTKDQSTYIGGGFSWSRSFKAASEKIACQTDTDDAVNCVEGVFADPSRDIDATLFGEIRRTAPKGVPFVHGASLRVGFDLQDDEWLVEAPIYFLKNAEDKFNGGLKVEWNPEDQLIFGVFVGADFDLVGGP